MDNERTVNALIRDNLFRIPIYQRSYVWTEKNWEALWQDILAVASGKFHKHFIGSIIYSKEQEEDKEQEKSDVYLVIDGQQRLTTFTLLVAAVCYWLADKQCEKAKEKLRDFKNNYLFKEVSGCKEQRFRLRPADSNKDYFEKILVPLRLRGDLTSQFPSKESQIYAAFNYFKDRIEKYSRGERVTGKNTEEQQVDRIATLVSSAFEKMLLIPMKLEADDDAQRIFECMNYRGQALEQSDLIRNYVLQGWEREKRIQFHDDYWVKMENAAKDQFAKKKADEDHVPEFFRDYLSMREGKNVKERDIFHTFKTGERYDCSENGVRSANKMERILQEIRRFSGYYDRILNSIKTKPNETFDGMILRHLWYINQLPQASTTYPFLLRLLDDYAEQQILDKSTLVTCLEIVQSYIVRCVFCNRGRKAFNKIFSPLYRKAFSESEYFDKKAERLKKGITSESYVECVQRGLGTRSTDEKFLSDKEFEEGYQEFKLYRNKAFCKYVLLRLEEKMSSKKSDTLPNEGLLTIEHIFPQRPGYQWSGKTSDGLTQTIGNLTLTAQNAEMGNKTFAEKKKIGFDNSGLKLNQYLADLDPRTKWNGERIRERAVELYKLMRKIWQDIPKRCRKDAVSDEIAMKDIDTEDFENSELWDGKKPAKISLVIFGEVSIDGGEYAADRKPKGSWKQEVQDLPPAWGMPDGIFYNEILQCLYIGHEGTFDNTPLGESIGLEKTEEDEEEENGIRFVVPSEIIDGQNGHAVQAKYDRMWQNIKRAAEETGVLGELRIRFKN